MEENNAMEMQRKHENAMLQLAKVLSRLFFYLDDAVFWYATLESNILLLLLYYRHMH